MGGNKANIHSWWSWVFIRY